MSTPSTDVLAPGAVFHGRYRVVRCIKAGGMGAVYEVVDDKTDVRRALKVMLPSVIEDPDHRARFALEAKVTGAIESDHIVRVSDSGIDDASGTPFLVMDLLRGDELGHLAAQRRRLTPAEIVVYLYQAALALDKTHAAGIVHRDLKPENLFVTSRDDGSPCVKILDFGIAKVVAQSQAKATRALGTPLYMSPEQIRGEGAIGHRADLYALAHIAYALLAGEAYWTEESKVGDSLFPMLTAIVRGAPEAASARAQRRSGAAIPPGFDAWFQRATSVEPEARFDRATSMIQAFAQATGVAAPGAPVAQPAQSQQAPIEIPSLPSLQLPARPVPQLGNMGTVLIDPPPARLSPRAAAKGTIPITPIAPPQPEVIATTAQPPPAIAQTAIEPAAITAHAAARPAMRSALPIVLGALTIVIVASVGVLALSGGEKPATASSAAASSPVAVTASNTVAATAQPAPTPAETAAVVSAQAIAAPPTSTATAPAPVPAGPTPGRAPVGKPAVTAKPPEKPSIF